ncbi:hypothetical protein ACFX2C_042634 [Malus domestica]
MVAIQIRKPSIYKPALINSFASTILLLSDKESEIFSSKESDCPEISLFFNVDKKNEYYRKLREDLKKVDKDDKVLYRHRCREKRLKDKIKSKRGNTDEQEEDDVSDSEGEPSADRPRKRPKIYFDSESDGEIKKRDKPGFIADSLSLEEQEAIALKLLSSMHSQL